MPLSCKLLAQGWRLRLLSLLGFVFIPAGAMDLPITPPEKFLAPFDFHWGRPAEETPAHYQLDCHATAHGQRCETQRLQVPEHNEYYFTLYFHEDLGLVRLIYHEDVPAPDYSGRVGQERFFHLRALLLQKYSGDKTYDFFSMFNKYYFDRRTEFYQCLHNEDCGVFTTFIHPHKGEGA